MKSKNSIRILVLISVCHLFLAQCLFAVDLDSFFKNEQLFISQYPQQFKSPGLISKQNLKYKNNRFIFHYTNISQEPLFLNFILENPYAFEISIDIYKGVSKSIVNSVVSGGDATYNFFKTLLEEPIRIKIPAFSSYQVLLEKINKEQTLSGVITIKALQQNIGIKIAMIDMRSPHISGFMDVPDAFLQFKCAQFNQAYKPYQVLFDATKELSHLRIGDKPYLFDPGLNYELEFNYGVIHDFKIKIKNDYDHNKIVSFFLMPSKKNQKVLLINNKVIKSSILQLSKNKVPLEKVYHVLMKPTEEKTIRMLTMPQPGSYYPIDILIKTGNT